MFTLPLPASIPITIPPPAPPPPPPHHSRTSISSPRSDTKSPHRGGSNTPKPSQCGSVSPVAYFGKPSHTNASSLPSSSVMHNTNGKPVLGLLGSGLKKENGGVGSSASSVSGLSSTPITSSSTQVRVNNYPAGKFQGVVPSPHYLGPNYLSANNNGNGISAVQTPAVMDRDLERAQKMCDVCPGLEQEVSSNILHHCVCLHYD